MKLYKQLLSVFLLLNNITRIFVILLLALGSRSMFAQTSQGMVDSAAIDYLLTTQSYSLLYYGAEYESYQRTKNHPFLVSDLYSKARLSYQNVIYPEALVRLDQNRNELVVRSPGFRDVVLLPGNVDFVELHGYHVIFFQKDSLPGCPSTGYYIRLYDNKCKALKKTNVQLMEKTSPGLLERFFDFSTRHYLYKDGAYYNIKNKRGLLKALNPYKKELKRFISSRKLNFRDNTEMFLILTISEYEQLANLK